jgi:hypothetical protein
LYSHGKRDIGHSSRKKEHIVFTNQPIICFYLFINPGLLRRAGKIEAQTANGHGLRSGG